MDPIPIRPDASALAADERRSLHRGLAGIAIGARKRTNPVDFVKSTWPADTRAAQLVTRATTEPTMQGEFPERSAILSFQSLAPQSALMQLLARGLQLNLAGVTSAMIPTVVGAPQAVFVSEGASAPVTASPRAGSALLGRSWPWVRLRRSSPTPQQLKTSSASRWETP
jgi:hypothetical protein